MKSAFSYIFLFMAFAGLYVFHSAGNSELQAVCVNRDANHCQFIEAVSDFHAIAPTQNQLTVRTCQVSQKNLFNGFFEVVKSSSKVFFNTFSSNKVNPAGFLIKFCKFDISFPFNAFW